MTAIPSAVEDPAHKIVYLIDTINGKEQILQNYNARPLYRMWENELDGINFDNDMFETDKRIVIITYAKFGVLLDRDPDFHKHFDYIICDELHSLIKFQYFSRQPNYHSIAKRGLERAVRNDHTKVVALTATPTQVENEFDTPKYRIPIDDIFIEFNRQTLDRWLESVRTLSEKYAAAYREFCEAKGWTITAERNAIYVMMHTFAHLMIKQMSMSSGYSSTAIRERIYFSDRMAGILFYTGSADKEGSLGGLVELGTVETLAELMRDAFQEALLCTNDPECLHNMPAGKNSNGAACHSCCMISETACENGNRMLDRGLVVPIAERENQAYFRELVIELCQLAM